MPSPIPFPSLLLLAFLATILVLGRSPVVPLDGVGALLVSAAMADDDDDEDDDDDDGDGDGDDDDDDEEADDDDDDDDDPPEFVVVVPNAADLTAIEALGYSVLGSERIDLIDGQLARLSPRPGLSVEAARTEIQGIVGEAVVDLNHVYRPEELACGPEGCAAFALVGWTGGSRTCTLTPTIGMIDTGVNAEHPALAPGSVETVPVLGKGRQPGSERHGTAVALILAGRSDSSTPGLLPSAKIIAAEAFHRDAAGQDAADVFDIVRALERLSEEPIDAVNLSFSGPANPLLERALQALDARGLPVVAAVGNAGPLAPPLFPAAYPGAIAVTAVDRSNDVYRNANAGEHVDFAAPGVRLWTAASISGGRFRSGTSFAAPFVTAAVALRRLEEPDTPVADLVAAMAADAVDLGEPGRDATFGFGLVQMPPCGDAAAPQPVSTDPEATQEALPAAPEGPR